MPEKTLAAPSEEEPGDGFLFHTEDRLHRKFSLSVKEHVIVHITDQKQDQQCDRTYGYLHAAAQYGEIKFPADIRTIVPAGNGQEGIEEHGTDRHGDNIDQIVSGGTLHIPEDQFKIHHSVHPLTS